MPSIDLAVPSHEEAVKPLEAELELPKPIINNPEGDNRSVISIPETPKTGIEVRASRDGFYNQSRYAEGQTFIVSDWSKVGMWMVCVDPFLEKKRLQLLKDKKARN